MKKLKQKRKGHKIARKVVYYAGSAVLGLIGSACVLNSNIGNRTIPYVLSSTEESRSARELLEKHLGALEKETLDRFTVRIEEESRLKIGSWPPTNEGHLMRNDDSGFLGLGIQRHKFIGEVKVVMEPEKIFFKIDNGKGVFYYLNERGNVTERAISGKVYGKTLQHPYDGCLYLDDVIEFDGCYVGSFLQSWINDESRSGWFERLSSGPLISCGKGMVRGKESNIINATRKLSDGLIRLETLYFDAENPAHLVRRTATQLALEGGVYNAYGVYSIITRTWDFER